MGMSHFEDVPRYYPGSNKPIIERKPVVVGQKDPDAWDAHPLIYPVNGEDMEFFTNGHLGDALDGRSDITMRKWEKKGFIPKATYYKPGKEGNVHGRRRLYSRAQVEGIVRIAKEEGIFPRNSRIKVSSTNFTRRVVALFRELAQR